MGSSVLACLEGKSVQHAETVFDGELFSRGVLPLVHTDSLLFSFKIQNIFHGLFIAIRVSTGLGGL